MLFDTESPGRRRAVQIIFGGLAVLLASGLVLFGIGTVEARRSWMVGPTVAGRVLRVQVDVGDTVKRIDGTEVPFRTPWVQV